MTASLEKHAGEFLSGIGFALKEMEIESEPCRTFTRNLIEAMTLAKIRQELASTDEQKIPRAWAEREQRVSLDATAQLIASLYQVAEIFDWKDGARYWPEPEYQYFADKLYSTCFVGSVDAAFSAQEWFLALLMIFDTGVLYPLHSHRISELYFVLSGTGEWSHDGDNWEKLSPGSIFFNDTWQPHALRALEEPIIAMGFYLPPFSWEGGLIGDEDRDITEKI